MEISWKDFDKVEMRVGTVLEVKDFPEAKNPAYRLQIDFGAQLGIRNLQRKSRIATPEKICWPAGDRSGQFSEETNSQLHE